ncbi:hypothetical protein B0T20DRAFT_348361 [Sordaria brevicollis]|uniref:Uncharacterized protein n=1 Tax=Sordaria brevicollis TaxID=83679 RepID=A0AAE0PJV8_SORBR|nr:hypothetical protein B0T20DRAFT_348361 [Sordaria brevicollis]
MDADSANHRPNGGPVGADIFDEPVTYMDLKAWIAEQEALPQPEPLTDVQKRAILDLKRSIRKEKHTFNLTDADWVSLIMRYRDAHQAEGCTVEFNDNHQNHVGQVGFMCFVSLQVTRDWQTIIFPSAENGLEPDEHTGGFRVPNFPKKKDAKQYAAKSAIEWLMYHHYMPSDCQNVVFKAANPQNGQSKRTPRVPAAVPTPQQTPTAPANTNEPANGKGAVSAPISSPATPSHRATVASGSNGGNGASLNPNAVSNAESSLAPHLAQPKPSRRRGISDNTVDIDVYDDSISIHQRVAAMCKRLGMQPPQVELTPISNMQDMFSGRAIFPVEAGPVPEHIGRVESGLFKKNTKEMVQEQVLEFLLQLEQERLAVYESLMADD